MAFTVGGPLTFCDLGELALASVASGMAKQATVLWRAWQLSCSIGLRLCPQWLLGGVGGAIFLAYSAALELVF